ncbi:hypothetical protein EDF46_2595 [Frondihabitans sp. PhB188]|nr:hypothetical protein EDF46_2595 [Frondihabitans sp. PhB188]
MPYAVGDYREAWSYYPALVRQYRPEYNGGIVLSQIPPAADVFLCWECELGHVFVATPDEQRGRPGPQRRRSAWCPMCTEQATPTRVPGMPFLPSLNWRAQQLEAPPSAPARPAPVRARRRPAAARPKQLCSKTPSVPAGEPFASLCAPAPASAVESDVRAELAARLEFTAGLNAVRLRGPFFDHLEAWPDILLPELRVAVEYDSTGRHGLEHVGKREDADRRKDRALRAVGWEVVRIRTGRLLALGPHDVLASGPSKTTLARFVDELRAIRGDLIVDAYLR